MSRVLDSEYHEYVAGEKWARGLARNMKQHHFNGGYWSSADQRSGHRVDVLKERLEQVARESVLRYKADIVEHLQGVLLEEFKKDQCIESTEELLMIFLAEG